MEWLLAGLLTLSILAFFYQQRFFMREIQKLVDKSMSRDLTEYARASIAPSVKAKVQLPQEPPEDLRILQEFNLAL